MYYEKYSQKNAQLAHFLNPAYLIPLVEVSPHGDTANHVVARFITLLESIGKVPIKCKATPGYIVPRLQSLIMSEACRMVEQGVGFCGTVFTGIGHVNP